MGKKRFQTHAPTETQTLEIENPAGAVAEFVLNPPIPGMVLIDYLSGMDAEDSQSQMDTFKTLIAKAIREEDQERWAEYVRDPENHVDLAVLMEIATWCSEVLSGNPQPQSLPFGSG